MAEKTPPAAPVDPDNVTLSPEDLVRIRAKAAKMVAEERKRALEAQALEAALEEIRGKEGLVIGDPVEDEIVNITINLADGACGRSPNGNELNGIRVNGREYQQGKTYPVQRHVARSLMEAMWRTWVHEHGITDKPWSDFYRKPRHTMVSARRGITNAPVSPA